MSDMQRWRWFQGWTRYVALLAAVVCLAAAGGCRTASGVVAYTKLGSAMQRESRAGEGRLEMAGPVSVLHLYGTPSEMGRQYGTILRTALKAMHVCLDVFMKRQTRQRLLAYAEAHEKDLPDDIRQEIAGMAETSGVPYMELVAMNVVPKLSCSTLAVWDERGTDGESHGLIMGRNADYYSAGLSDRGALVVVHHPEQGLATAAVTFLGMVGAFTGMNEKGVCFGNMLVFNAAGPQEQEGGWTIQIAHRVAAERASTAAEMAQILTTQRHTIPMNSMVADAHEALVVELGLNGSAIRRGEGGVLASSNQFQTPALASELQGCLRLGSLLSAGRNVAPRMTVEQMKKALFDARIEKLNIQAVVFEPAGRRMHVSINRIPASKGPYELIDGAALFDPLTSRGVGASQ